MQSSLDDGEGHGESLMSHEVQPLDDIRVLDLTHYYHGPYATMLLSYLGADITKIEAPGFGDGMRALFRRQGQPFGYAFGLMNFNKRSITLNLKSDEGKEIFKRLVRKADVVENDELERAVNELTELVRGLLAPAGTMSRP